VKIMEASRPTAVEAAVRRALRAGLRAMMRLGADVLPAEAAKLFLAGRGRAGG
jgi:hypothetical protein